MFLIDVSSSMGKLREIELPDGPRGEKRVRETTNLEWAMQFVLLKVQEMVRSCGSFLQGVAELVLIVNLRVDIQWEEDGSVWGYIVWD